MRRVCLLVSALAALAGCGDTSLALRLGGPDGGNIIVIFGRDFALETRLLQRGAAGGGLQAGVTLRGDGPDPVPAALRLDSLTAIHDAEVWRAELRPSGGDTPPNELRVAAGEGPDWPPGAEVEVIVRLVGDRGPLRVVQGATVGGGEVPDAAMPSEP